MSVFDMIGTILIGPLKVLFEMIFSIAYRMIKSPGPSIIVLSLAMNILVLPLYRRADAIQMASRDTENRMRDVVTHIKKTFSGDERMMILQTYYRQNNYNPLSVLSGSISLMLEIPFFMAAYQFLSGVGAFSGASFGPIADLSAPDGLLVIGGMTINLLPILMTLINVISSSLYLKGFPLKDKIQLYGMALFFLVFLYNSPSALVFYWTLNNTFSLFKTLFYKIKNSRTVLNILLCITGIALIVAAALRTGRWSNILLLCVGMSAQLPWILSLMKKAGLMQKQKQVEEPQKSLFICGTLFLTVLVGFLIPSAYISASPQEYIDISYFYNPNWYVVRTLCLSAGTFLVWMGVFYWLANSAGKVIFSRLVWIMSGVMLVNYMFFGANLGVVSPDLQYTDGFGFARKEQLVNMVIILLLVVLLYLISVKLYYRISSVLLIGAIALAGMSVVNVVKTTKIVEETKTQISSSAEEMPSFSLSKEGKNVVVIMLDRGIGPFIPYLMEENPTLQEQFDGFTYYANTLSYGGFTNFATPALYGGYEYTPVNLNLRSSELLADKHNEALKVLPTLFAEEGYDVTLLDPSYAGYKWIPDVSIFDGMDGVKAYQVEGKFDNLDSQIATVEARKRNFFLFSLMKTMPVTLQSPIYDEGKYRTVQSDSTEHDTSGGREVFMKAYNVLKNMTTMTNITDEAENTYMFLRSNATHEAVILQEPLFEPRSLVDNSVYYSEEGKTITAGDNSLLLDNEYKISHYHINMSSLMQLGTWFDYLKENNVYDNTRIIIVSDHGRDLQIFDNDAIAMHDIDFYQPMLLMKDFGAHGFVTSEEFMTNADVPTLAMEELIENPVNPFTGKSVDASYKIGNDTHWVILSDDWNISKNNGNQFLEAEWAAVSGDVRKKENWEFYTELSVLPAELQQ